MHLMNPLLVTAASRSADSRPVRPAKTIVSPGTFPTNRAVTPTGEMEPAKNESHWRGELLKHSHNPIVVVSAIC